MTIERTVCLSMIVKNEAHVIERCLASVLPLIDCWVICDTGSTDGTQGIIKAFFERYGKPGKLYERPWRDFAHNRNEAIELTKGEARYALIIDADDLMVCDEGFDGEAFRQSLSADIYDVEIHHGSMRHYRPHIYSTKLALQYRGVLHEFIELPPGPLMRETAHGISMKIAGGGGRSQDPNKFRKDAAVLEAALRTEADPFMRSRYTFYLAQSYRDCGEDAKALEAYIARAGMGFWEEEVYVALHQAAKIKEALGYPEDEVIAAYERATGVVPTRLEALHHASRYCRSKGRNKQGAEIARRGLAISAPASGLFIEDWIYQFGLLDEFAVNAYWSGDYQGCLDACERILNTPGIDDGLRQRIRDNAMFARNQIAEQSAVKPTLGEMQPRVMIAILAKDKAGHLPLYLSCIEALDYPKDRIAVYVRTNNNTDSTASILRAWVERVRPLYSDVTLDDSDVPERVQDFGEHEWNATRFSVLGRIRQQSMDAALALGCDFYFVADVDNFVRPDTLRSLVAADRPIVAPLLKCADSDRPLYSNFHHAVDENGYLRVSPEYHALLAQESPGLHEVAVVHCTYLVRADVIPRLRYDDGSARYEYVIFSDSARQAGIPQVLDTRAVYGWITFDTQPTAVELLLRGGGEATRMEHAPETSTHDGTGGAKRAIRLKEYPANARLSHTPSEEYVTSRGHRLERRAYVMETDEDGFIRGDQSPASAEKSVVVLGDSVVESMFLDPDKRFCARLESLLRTELNIDVRVRNGGYSGATSLHVLNTFLNKVIPLKPDLVIVMTGIVDVDAAYMPASFWSDDCYIEPIIAVGGEHDRRENRRLGAGRFDERRRILDLLAAAARQFGVELWFATVPHQHRAAQQGADMARDTRDRLEMNEVTRGAAGEGGHRLCDIEALLCDRSDCFHDMYHLNETGSQAVALGLLGCGLPQFLRKSRPSAITVAKESGAGAIFVINLDRSIDRWSRFSERNGHLGRVERFSAVDGASVDRARLIDEGVIRADLAYKPGTLGCALSHIALWQKAVAEDRSITVLEDDIVTHPDFVQIQDRMMESAPEGWDMLLWGYIYDPLFVWTSEGFADVEMRFYNRRPAPFWGGSMSGMNAHHFRPLRHAFGTQGYSISAKGARRALKDLLPLGNDMIQFPHTNITTENSGIDCVLNAIYPITASFCCFPPLVVHDDGGASDRVALDSCERQPHRECV